jgi:hypothetical protein
MGLRIKLFSVVSFAFMVVCQAVYAQWTGPVPVEEINTLYQEKAPFLSFDGLTLYYDRANTDTFSGTRLYQATRAQPFGAFTQVQEISSLNGSGRHVSYAWVSPDNLRMYYYTNTGVHRLKFTERASVFDPWIPGTNISELNAMGGVANPSLTADELTIVFTGYNLPGGQGDFDIWRATRLDRDMPFGNITNIASVNSSSSDAHPGISADGLRLYFTSNRNGNYQLFEATRESVEEAFNPPVHLSFFDTPGGDSTYPCLSGDGTAFYFTRNAPGLSREIWVTHLVKMEVAVDIKPGNCPNPLNPSSREVLPVAILGSAELDVIEIDVASIRLVGVSPVRSSFEDVAAPVVDGNVCDCMDSDGDGYMDLTLKFKTVDVVEQLIGIINDLANGDQVALTLTGVMIDQMPIEGEDCVIIVGNVPQSIRARKADINEDGIVNMSDFGMMTSNWLVQTSID